MRKHIKKTKPSNNTKRLLLLNSLMMTVFNEHREDNVSLYPILHAQCLRNSKLALRLHPQKDLDFITDTLVAELRKVENRDIDSKRVVALAMLSVSPNQMKLFFDTTCRMLDRMGVFVETTLEDRELYMEFDHAVCRAFNVEVKSDLSWFDVDTKDTELPLAKKKKVKPKKVKRERDKAKPIESVTREVNENRHNANSIVAVRNTLKTTRFGAVAAQRRLNFLACGAICNEMTNVLKVGNWTLLLAQKNMYYVNANHKGYGRVYLKKGKIKTVAYMGKLPKAFAARVTKEMENLHENV